MKRNEHGELCIEIETQERWAEVYQEGRKCMVCGDCGWSKALELVVSVRVEGGEEDGVWMDKVVCESCAQEAKLTADINN